MEENRAQSQVTLHQKKMNKSLRSTDERKVIQSSMQLLLVAILLPTSVTRLVLWSLHHGDQRWRKEKTYLIASDWEDHQHTRVAQTDWWTESISHLRSDECLSNQWRTSTERSAMLFFRCATHSTITANYLVNKLPMTTDIQFSLFVSDRSR